MTNDGIPWHDAVADIAIWRTLGDDGRRAALDGIVAALGPEFQAGMVRCGRDSLATVVHTSGVELAVIPGGRYAMGYTLDDVLTLWRALPVGGPDDTDLGRVRASIEPARPPKDTVVRPFLASRQPVDARTLRAAAKLDADATISAVLARLGWRLPEESEWEWFAREGGAVRFVGVPPGKHPLSPSLRPPAEQENGWGLGGLLDEENLCQTGTRMGHTAWQSEAEVIGLHVATRISGDNGEIRLCRDIPGATVTGATLDWAAQVTDLLAALTGKGKDRERALRTLACAGGTGGPDLAAAMATLADRLDAFEAKVLPTLVALLAHAGPQGRARAVGLLRHTDTKVRAAAVFALGSAPTVEEQVAIAPRIAVEKKPLVLAGLAFALADDRVEPLTRHNELLVRTAALLAISARRPARLDREALLTLATAISLPVEPDLRWMAGDLAAAALHVLDGASADVKRVVAESLVQRGDPDALRAALNLVFGPARVGRPALLDPATLDEPQHTVATAFANGAVGVDISSWGLPVLAEDLRRWLGLDPPGAMEALVTWGGRTAPFWRHATDLHNVAAAEWWDEDRWIPTIRPLLDALEPRLRLEIAAETGRYRLFPQTENRWGLPWPEPEELVAGFDPAEVHALLAARLAIVGDSKRIVQRLLVLWSATGAPPPQRG